MSLLHFLLYSLFITIFLADAQIVKQLGSVAGYIAWIPDILSIAFVLVVVGQLSVRKRLDVAPKYVFLGAIVFMHLLLGVLINSVQPGAVFAGLRAYLKCMPLFLLPMVIEFTDGQMARYLKFVVLLSLIQLPFALYQRFIEGISIQTGDVVRGTLTSSGILSIYLISAIAMLTAFYVRRRIKIGLYILLLVALFIPTTINESKGTLILLPFALAIPTFYNRAESVSGRMRKIMGSALVGVVLVGIYVNIYDRRWGGEEESIISMYSEGGLASRLYKDQEPGRGYDTGRIDSIVLALKELSVDPVKLAVGLGMGNVAASFSRVLIGEYSEVYADYGVRVTTVAYLLWETGLLGVFLVMIFLYILFKDVRILSAREGFPAVVALGWAAVVSIVFLSMFYKTLIEQNAIDYLFWFISGYLVAKSKRLSDEMKREASTT
jgi:hypothetical protein